MEATALSLISIALTAIMSLAVWFIKRLITSNDTKTDALIAATNANTSALEEQVGGLTQVVQDMNVQNAVIVKSLEFINEKMLKTDVKFTNHEGIHRKLFDRQDDIVEKVNEIESSHNKLLGICETQHGNKRKG